MVSRKVVISNPTGPVSYTHLDVYKRQPEEIVKCPQSHTGRYLAPFLKE